MSALRRYIDEGYVYHVSSATHERHPIFRSLEAAQVLLDAIDFQRVHRALVLAYVVMPDHFHALIAPRTPSTISKVMLSIKGYTSRFLNERKGERGRLWQPSFHDRVIRSEPQLWRCVEYIHENPVKARLRASRKIIRIRRRSQGARLIFRSLPADSCAGIRGWRASATESA